MIFLKSPKVLFRFMMFIALVILSTIALTVTMQGTGGAQQHNYANPQQMQQLGGGQRGQRGGPGMQQMGGRGGRGMQNPAMQQQPNPFGGGRRSSVNNIPSLMMLPPLTRGGWSTHCTASREAFLRSQQPETGGTQDSGVQGKQRTAVLVGGPGDCQKIDRLKDGSWPAYKIVEHDEQDYLYMVRVIPKGEVIYIPTHAYPTEDRDRNLHPSKEDQ